MRVAFGVVIGHDAVTCIPTISITVADPRRACRAHTSFAVVTNAVTRTVVIHSTAPITIIGYPLIDIGIVIVPQSTAASRHSHILFVCWFIFAFAFGMQQEAGETKEKYHCSCPVHFPSVLGNQATTTNFTLVCNVLTKAVWAENSKAGWIPCITSESFYVICSLGCCWSGAIVGFWTGCQNGVGCGRIFPALWIQCRCDCVTQFASTTIRKANYFTFRDCKPRQQRVYLLNRRHANLCPLRKAQLWGPLF